MSHSNGSRPDGGTKRRPGWLVPALAIGFGCLLAVGALEIAVRVLRLAPSASIGSVDADDFERVPGLLTPGQRLRSLEKPALPHDIRINAHGYRGPDLADARAAAGLRILAVGDSFTYGDFVDDDESLPARLEAALEDRLAPRCGGVEVVNAGIGGSTIVTHAQMVHRARALEPDVVLLTFSENDVSDLLAPQWDSLAANRARKSAFPLRYVYPILRRTALWNFALGVRAAAKARATERSLNAAAPAQDEATVAVEAPGERTAALREAYVARLRALRDDLQRAGVPLVFAVYPSHHALDDPDAREQLDWIEREARALGLEVVPLLPALRASGQPRDALYLLPHDGHPSPAGYEIAAASLAARVDWDGHAREACAR